MKDEGGQALALGVLGLLLLTIGLYMTITLGRHVREKIHVQTTADAMALSLAQLEAQSFNYIAFANRAQVAHYVTMMNLQAYVSYLSAMEHLTLMAAVLAKIAEDAASIAAGSGIDLSPVKGISSGLFELYQTIAETLDTLDPIVDEAIKNLERLNHVMWASEVAMSSIVAAHIGPPLAGQEIFQTLTKQNDSNWSNTPASLVVNTVLASANLNEYQKAFARVGGVPFAPASFDSGVETQRAKTIMTEVVNATRFDEALVHRKVLPRLIGGSGHTLTSIADWIEKTFRKMFGLKIRMRGESKLIGTTSNRNAPLEAILSQHPGVGGLTQGDVMASADEYTWAKGSVWTSAQGLSTHCRAKKTTSLPHGVAALWKVFLEIINGKFGGECKDNDGHHRYSGITPYMLYQAGHDAEATAPGGNFHEPSVLVWLHKSAEQAGYAKTAVFSWTTPKGTRKVDLNMVHTASGLANGVQGVHAFARAEAYYHRPGNWAEPPSFFNPFWRARLAPVVDPKRRNDSEFDLFSLLPDVPEDLVLH